MANTPVEVIVGVTGLAGMTIELFPRGSDAIANGAGGDALTEETNRGGCYQATVTQALVGVYEVYVLTSAGALLYTGAVELADDASVYTVGELGDVAVSSRASQASVDAIAGGTGARTVGVTVDDGTTALESATVRFTKGAESYVQSTDASGQSTFNLDDGTWTVAISLAGYSFTGASLVVDGDKTPTYSMTAISFTAPSAPGRTTGRFLCVGTDGLPEAGVTIQAKMTNGPGTAGYALDTGTITMTSDANGIAEHTGFVKAAYYKFLRGNEDWTAAQLAPSTDEWSIGEVLGQP